MGKLTIVGLGPGGFEHMTIETIDKMKNADKLYLRTEKHPVVKYLRDMGLSFETFDKIYEKASTFEEVYDNITREIIEIAEKCGNVVYAVPGNPLVAEKTVEYLLKFLNDNDDIKVEVVPAMSFVDVVVNELKIDPIYGLKIIDGLSLDSIKPDKRCNNLVTQVYNRRVASEVKLKLMDIYGDEFLVTVVKSAGVKGEQRIETMPLYKIDMVDWIDYLTSIFIPPVKGIFKARYDIDDLLDIMAKLRGENGCPWDKEQDHSTLKRYLIEECYEVIDAIEKDSDEGLLEELGDVLLQVVFHSQIADERKAFDFHDVCDAECKKMIYRHPHVFGVEEIATSADVLKRWDEIKKDEKGFKSHTNELKSVPRSMPALIRGYKVQEKAAKVGFDWDNVDDAMAKVYEELNEFKEVYKGKDENDKVEELGDLIFAVVNVARFLKIDPEIAVHKTIEKFIQRFNYIEDAAEKSGHKLEDMTLSEMDSLWNEAKMNKFNKKAQK
ncbi:MULTISPECIES: nucleoside triphosphate pyrophosphohydrolase [Thermoanaerobacterium]|uniref:MazG family protein n=2 Tax=Thermoanaerobacterium TaxID=28895 RepID=W9EAJ6_9THEO|nr:MULTISPECIES: nucleoside triphosphate pyrophosphohydrolase [Thermoanaerobacterium]AFK85841.1 MazG family protein [Thermoanaerobacterium saccharolyticum JW/SL-YS485]ETO37950.1 MazG family protein [Thermoanaerobacterium aotearoense SCUT27]